MGEETTTITITSKQVNVGLLVGSLLLGVPAGSVLFNDPRPDPWTGTQARAEHTRIWKWIHEHEAKKSAIMLKGEKRITELEGKVKRLEYELSHNHNPYY